MRAPAFALAIVLAAASGLKSQQAPTPAEAAIYNGLLAAVYAGDTGAVDDLLKAGADLEARDAYGRTAVHLAAYQSLDDIMATLAKAGADMNALENQAYDVVTIASVADDPELLRVALELGASAGNVTSPYDGTALIAAAHLGHFEVIEILVAAGAPLDHVNNLNWTALLEVVILGDGGPAHQWSMQALLDGGADASIADGSGDTPLDHARRRGYLEMIQLLEER